MNGVKSNTATGTTGTASSSVRGRFAPSPTGLLHQGSLYTALGSWLSARAQGGQWLVRIEDIDQGRANPAFSGHILQTLEAFALHWDGPVVYQSQRLALYEAALNRLTIRGLVYPCSCSRRDLPAAHTPLAEPFYPGTCREGPQHPERACALRVRVPDRILRVYDSEQGWHSENLAERGGDFTLRRRDGFYAYPLAVVVDDAEQGITEVVRGLDLWPQTVRQRWLQQALGFQVPHYSHLPLVVEPDGQKLSKSQRSIPVNPAQAPHHLAQALTALGLNPPHSLQQSSPHEMLQWALEHWALRPRLPASIPAWPTPP